jgi:rRNA small subunit pseudouridine methyltransferase Nep1
VLEGATLETVTTKKGLELLNCDDHQNYMRKKGRDWSVMRPDITHQCLLSLMDSPLNKAGLLQVFIHTNKNQLITIDPQTRIPRTYKRFCGLMVQLINELKIQSVEEEGKRTLLKVIKNPITQHIPIDCRKIGTSSKAETIDLESFVNTLDLNKPVLFVVGAISKGEVNVDYTDCTISFSRYSLSASVACSKICNVFEKVWAVL